MTRDLHKRLGKLEAEAPSPGQAYFLRMEGPSGLPEGEKLAFLRSHGHRWGPNDIVFLTVYEGREANTPLRDLSATRG